ncbi:helix-turn-helix transcriptional regulator [Nonomuraea sp. PA05]|uniref:helix-turn-helix transcriptional regulator n=1 Tax=Nonomuraea sp. PA05 TaxID=2604466 RepID=UPI001CA384B5|nr:LuxR family transcriptional regulator [Nonomuraea sp. PA05]
MVGRDGETAVLLGLIGEARLGRGGVVLVTGEAGIGKSRLLAECGDLARAAGLAVLGGRSAEGGGTFRAVAQALAGRASPGALPEELRPYRGMLGRLLPEWAEPGDAPPPHVDPILVLGEGLLRLLRVVGEDAGDAGGGGGGPGGGEHAGGGGGPGGGEHAGGGGGPGGGEHAGGAGGGCVLVLEDVHWADADTLALIEYLATASSRWPALIVVSARDDEPGAPDHLSRLLLLPEVTTLRLGRLCDADIAVLARGRAGTLALPDDLLSHVVVQSDGLPYLAEELVAGILESGTPQVTPRLACRIAARLTTLTPAQRTVLEAAAVLGDEVDATVLGPVTGRPEPEVLAALRAADPRLLVRAADEVGGRLRWRHALTREVVLASVTPPERAAVARRAAEALLSRADPRHDAHAAALLAAAGEQERSAGILLRLARLDLAGGALHSAEDLLARASEAPALRPVVTIEQVRLLTLLGRPHTALESGAWALEELTGDRHAELCLRLAEAAVVARRWRAADRYVERAGRPGDPWALVLAADSAFGAGDLRRAVELAAVAVERAKRAGRWETVCRALTTIGRCALGHDPELAREAYGLAARVGAEHGLLPARVTALFGLAAIELLGSPDSPLLAEARELARRTGLLAEVVRTDLLRVNSAVTVEGPRAARDLAVRTATQAGRLRLHGMRAVAEVFAAMGYAAEGDAPRMEAVLADAAARPDPPVEVAAQVHAARGLLHLLRHDLPEATALFDAALRDLVGRCEAGPVHHWGLWALLRTVVADRGAEARETLRRSPAVFRAANRAGLQYADAVAAGREGQRERAAALFADGDSTLAGHHWWRRLLRLFALEAAIADGWGDPVPALRTDLEAHLRAGDAQLARICRDLLRGAGAPTRRGRGLATVPDGLRAAGVTSREMDVLGLVAEGLSNRKIAERLFISPRTVDTHVSNLLAKTASTDRADLRARARRP